MGLMFGPRHPCSSAPSSRNRRYTIDRRLFPTLFVDFFAGPLCLLVQIGKRSAQTLQTRMRTMGENVDIDFQN